MRGAKYIARRGNKYLIYKTINGNKKCYGSFSSLDEAIKRRDELTAINWGVPIDEMPSPGKKGKYGKNIVFHNGYFKVSKLINGQQRFIGVFKTAEEAINLRNFLVSINWDLDKLPKDIINSSNDYKNKYIQKFRGEYVVSKNIDGERHYFGRFANLNDAIELRNKLIENNWQVDETLVEEKVDEFVFCIDGVFIVKKIIDDEFIEFGRFNKMCDAINFRNNCIKNNWDLSLISY